MIRKIDIDKLGDGLELFVNSERDAIEYFILSTYNVFWNDVITTLVCDQWFPAVTKVHSKYPIYHPRVIVSDEHESDIAYLANAASISDIEMYIRDGRDIMLRIDKRSPELVDVVQFAKLHYHVVRAFDTSDDYIYVLATGRNRELYYSLYQPAAAFYPTYRNSNDKILDFVATWDVEKIIEYGYIDSVIASTDSPYVTGRPGTPDTENSHQVN
jgi:hypothetical protein